MSATPTPLPGMPDLPGRVDDLEEWVKAVWPAYLAAADTAQPFTISEIAAKHGLPDPPKAQAQWGLLPGRLVKAGLVEEYRETGKSSRPGVHKSLVHQWIGIPAHRRTEAAA
jgi:hypothetical protein